METGKGNALFLSSNFSSCFYDIHSNNSKQNIIISLKAYFSLFFASKKQPRAWLEYALFDNGSCDLQIQHY
jgi:hypothetical protein